MANTKVEFVTTDGPEDSLPLQYMGAAALLRWNSIPPAVRTEIYLLATSGKLHGLDKALQLTEQIDRLLRRNTNAYER